jgi:hypothetical protein
VKRKILFRGKSASGSWVYGWAMAGYDARYYIETPDYEKTRVSPESVGQWTGEFDTCNTKIFEGDLVEYENFGVRRGEVCYREGSSTPYVGDSFMMMCRPMRVIGNTVDNPELKGVADGNG